MIDIMLKEIKMIKEMIKLFQESFYFYFLAGGSAPPNPLQILKIYPTPLNSLALSDTLWSQPNIQI